MAPMGKGRLVRGGTNSILDKQTHCFIKYHTHTHTHQNIDEQILLLEVFYLKPSTELR